MTIEITDTDDFKDKFAALMASNVSLITAGLEPSRELSSKMIDEFLNQFIVATPAPAPTYRAGYVVVAEMTGYIPGYFQNVHFTSPDSARDAIREWVRSTGHGKESAYGVREITYFG